MPENRERGLEAELASFRHMIQRFVELRKDIDGTVVLIKDVNRLKDAEKRIWDRYYMLLESLSYPDVNYKKSTHEAEELAEEIKVRHEDALKNDDSSLAWYYNWMTNRAAGIVSLLRLYFNEKLTLKEISDSFKQQNKDMSI